LKADYFYQSGGSVEKKIVAALVQMHGREQAYQAQVMVAMQMAYKDMVDACKTDFIPV
jgi:hypothetical protein